MGVVYEMLKDTRLRCTQVLDFLLDDYTKDHTALDDQTICERIAGRPIKTDELLDLAIRAADAIDAAHAKGIVHLDIKPKNIFAMRPWQVKVLDLQLMKLMPAGAQIKCRRAADLSKTETKRSGEPGIRAASEALRRSAGDRTGRPDRRGGTAENHRVPEGAAIGFYGHRF